MSRIIEIIRRIVHQELAYQRGSLLGVVSTIFPHESADDENNYEVNVRLKYEDLELRKVPVAVGHMGIAAPPKTGDLVLVQFVNGDLNQPVVTGRFYHDKERPPLHKAEDILFEQRTSDGKLNHLRFAPDGAIYIQRDVTKPEDNSEAKAGIKIDKDGNIELKTGTKIVIGLMNDGNIEIECDKMTITGNVDITGDLMVRNSSHSTVISGNEIMGK